MARFFLFLLIAAMLSAPPARAAWFDDWTSEQVLFQATFTVLAVADGLQTIDFRERLNHTETNPALGRQPDAETVRNMVTLGILMHLIVADLLSEPWRSRWQFLFIGAEANNVRHNYAIGARIRF